MYDPFVIIIAAVIQIVIGSFWYPPAGFGKIWIKEMKFTAKDIEKAKAEGMGKTYAAAFVGSALTSFVMVQLALLINSLTPMAGAGLGLLAWLGFAVPMQLSNVLWEGKSIKLFIIGTAYYLVSYTAVGALVGALV